MMNAPETPLMPKLGSTLSLAALAVAASAAAVLAGPRDRPTGDFVVAESRFGKGSVWGPVRAGRYGPEVRLPGGTWIACRRSCSETLRVETVDFWENQGSNRIDNPAGIFGDLTIRRRY
jgi:hypothetical protein